MKIRRPLASLLRGVPGAAAVWLRGGGWRWPRRGRSRCWPPVPAGFRRRPSVGGGSPHRGSGCRQRRPVSVAGGASAARRTGAGDAAVRRRQPPPDGGGAPAPRRCPQPPGAVDGGAGNLSPAPLRRGVVRCAAPQRAAQSAARCPPSSGRRAQRGAERRAEKRPPGACPLVGASGDKRRGHGVWLVCAAAHVSRVLRHPPTPAYRRQLCRAAVRRGWPTRKRSGLTPPVLPLHEKTIRRTPSGVPPN